MRDMQLVPGCNCPAGESGQSLVPSLQVPGVLKAWSMHLGLCGPSGRSGNGRNRRVLATNLGDDSDPRQLWPHSSPPPTDSQPSILRKGGVCLAQGLSHNIHWRSQERCLCRWELGEGVIFKWSRHLASGSTREAPFWLLNETLNKRTQWFKNVQRTRGPDQCVSNCHLDSLIGHTIYWVVLIRAILTDAVNKPKM